MIDDNERHVLRLGVNLKFTRKPRIRPPFSFNSGLIYALLVVIVKVTGDIHVSSLLSSHRHLLLVSLRITVIGPISHFCQK